MLGDTTDTTIGLYLQEGDESRQPVLIVTDEETAAAELCAALAVRQCRKDIRPLREPEPNVPRALVKFQAGERKTPGENSSRWSRSVPPSPGWTKRRNPTPQGSRWR